MGDEEIIEAIQAKLEKLGWDKKSKLLIRDILLLHKDSDEYKKLDEKAWMYDELCK